MQDTIKNLLEKDLENVLVELFDPRNDGKHLEAVIVSSSFENLSLLERHRKVKESLKELFADQIHALSIKTYTNQEWRKKYDR